jgi:hypothetical protein
MESHDQITACSVYMRLPPGCRISKEIQNQCSAAFVSRVEELKPASVGTSRHALMIDQLALTDDRVSVLQADFDVQRNRLARRGDE